MAQEVPVKKLIRTALYSSFILVGALAITPHVILSRPLFSDEFLMTIASFALIMLLIWAINIVLVCFTERYRQGRYAGHRRYILSYGICIALVVCCKPFIDSFIHGSNMAQAHFYAVLILVLFLNTIVLIIEDLVLLREKKTRIEFENAALKLKNAEATNQQLKQQIHPHFLFNSLSTLKTLIGKDHLQAEDYLVKLSDFLRASLMSGTLNTVKLSEELKLCFNYLDMQKMRFGKALRYILDIPEEVQQIVSVPVFSLLLLLENAVKHNKLTQELPLDIKVEFTDGRIIVSNNLQVRSSADTSMGLGLENLSERYRILSGDEVVILNDGKTFSVSIKALVNEDSNNRG
jgi:two-component system LytT family sensor kinase